MDDMMQTKSSMGRSQADLECHNNQQAINKLPAEILSLIFTLGELMGRGTGHSSDLDVNIRSDQGFRNLVVRVCRHWRTIAVNIPTLWNYITLSGPGSYERSAIFLARSGSTITLELEIMVIAYFMDGLEELDGPVHINRAIGALEFIIAHGGVTPRWGSLFVWSEMPDVILAVSDFLSNAPLDNLRILGVITEFEDPNTAETLTTSALATRDLSRSAVFTVQPPLLHYASFSGIPSDFFFARETTPLVSNLTYLELSTTPSLPPLIGLRELFIYNPRLEKLVLDMRLVSVMEFQPQPPASVRVSMPHLRQFTFKAPRSTFWGLSVLKMMDAPGVELFALDLTNLDDFIPYYLAFGRMGNQLVDDPFKSEKRFIGQPRRSTIYPVLKSLTLGPFRGSPGGLGDILGAFKTITRLGWDLGPPSRGVAIEKMLSSPSICPRLEHLRVSDVTGEALEQLVRLRTEDGTPLSLKTIKVDAQCWNEVTENTKQYLNGVLEKFGMY